jgi:hypothetical protein
MEIVWLREVESKMLQQVSGGPQVAASFVRCESPLSRQDLACPSWTFLTSERVTVELLGLRILYFVFCCPMEDLKICVYVSLERRESAIRAFWAS